MKTLPRRRYLFGFLLAAIVLAVVGANIDAATTRYRTDSASVARTYDVIGQIDLVRAGLLEAVLSQRNYLLTNQAGYLQVHDSEREHLRSLLFELERLLADNPAQVAREKQVALEIETRLRYTSRGIDIYASQGFDAARSYLVGNPGLALNRTIELHLGAMRTTEQGLLKQRRLASDDSANRLYVLGALGIPFSLLILGVLYYMLNREVRARQASEAGARSLNMQLRDSVQGLERASRELRELGHYASLLQSCRNMPEALDITRRTLALLMPQTAGTIYLLRESQDHAEAETSWGTHLAMSEPILEPHDCWALRRGQPHLVEELHRGLACVHIKPPDAPATVASCLCLPLNAHGVSLGLLYLSGPHGEDMPRLETATNVAEQLSLALANLRLQETLRHQSIRDPLTGLYNRRYLEESLGRELARCERRDLPLAVIMLDLDKFKLLNDRYGHEGGDAVLSALGRVLESNSRSEDVACRYGGEEFILILPEMDLKAATQRAEQIRAEVAGMSVRHLKHEISGITVSIGVAIYPAHASGAGLLKRLADEALYRAKRDGRNRVEIAVV